MRTAKATTQVDRLKLLGIRLLAQ